MAKVLITGASGFIGSHLATALVARGDEVTCLVRKTSHISDLQQLGVRLLYGDVTAAKGLIQAVAGQEIVYHLAGLTTALKNEHYFRVNQDGTRNIAQACAAQSRPPVLLLVSSLAAAGPALDGQPKSESDPPQPVSAYGQSKRGAEQQARLFAHRVPTTIVRPPIVLGQRDRVGLILFRSIDKFGIHLVPCLGRTRFSLIHADDLVELMILAAENGQRLPPPDTNGRHAGQGCYFAACEEDLVYDDLGKLIGEALGRRRVFPLHVPQPLVWTVAAGIDLLSHLTHSPFYLNLDKAREATAGSWICSPRQAFRDLGFSIKAPFVQRLRQTADWYRHEGWL